MKINALNEMNNAIGGFVKGFSIALGVAAAKWATIFIPLSGFNLSF